MQKKRVEREEGIESMSELGGVKLGNAGKKGEVE